MSEGLEEASVIVATATEKLFILWTDNNPILKQIRKEDVAGIDQSNF